MADDLLCALTTMDVFEKRKVSFFRAYLLVTVSNFNITG